MTPEQQQDILNRVTRLEAEKGTNDVVLNGIQKVLMDIQTKIDKAIVYNEKHDNLSKEVDKLREDYDKKKQQIDQGMGWLKGAFAVGGVTVSLVIALGIFIAKDGLVGIKDNAEKINDVQQKVQVLESRMNMGNPKMP